MKGQRPFAAEGTETKLKKVFEYANFYTTALRGKGFRLNYLDAFAGTGEIPTTVLEALPLLCDQADVADVQEGSARRALQVKHPFDRYIFNDQNRSHAIELEELKKEFPDREIHVASKDANDLIEGFCRKMEPHDRALVFLDPFGNQVSFKTLEVIADTKGIDLWYLFPAWWGVVRQIRQDGTPVPDSVPSIDRIFGTTEWLEEMRREVIEPDLFGEESVTEKTANVDNATRFMIERMKTIFGDGVSRKWLPLTWKGRASYSLLFACSNRKDNARSLALNVSRDIMTRK